MCYNRHPIRCIPVVATQTVAARQPGRSSLGKCGASKTSRLANPTSSKHKSKWTRIDEHINGSTGAGGHRRAKKRTVDPRGCAVAVNWSTHPSAFVVFVADSPNTASHETGWDKLGQASVGHDRHTAGGAGIAVGVVGVTRSDSSSSEPNDQVPWAEEKSAKSAPKKKIRDWGCR